MRAIVYRVRQAPDAAFIQLYLQSESGPNPPAENAQTHSITVIPTYLTRTPAVLSYLWSKANDVPAVPETTVGWTPRPLELPKPITAQAALYYQGADTATSNDEAPPSWLPPHRFAPAWPPIIAFSQGGEAPAAAEPETAQSWTPRPLELTRPSTAYLFSSGARDTDAPAADEIPPVWTPRPLRLNAVHAAPLYLFNQTAQDTSAPIEPETTAPWRRPQTFQPPWAPIVSFTGIRGDTPPDAPGEPTLLSWQPEPLRVNRVPLPAVNLYYLSGTAEDFGEQPASQFLVFWQYRTKYEDRVRQFFLRDLQGTAQDFDAPVVPDTTLGWQPRPLRDYATPLSTFIRLYWAAANAEQSSADDIGRSGWAPTALRVSKVPRAVHLYYRSATAQDTDAPPPPPPPTGHGSEFPQWLRRARLLLYHP